MLADFVDTLFSPSAMLWLAASAIAALILFGSLGRRRSRLTESLKGYVERTQGKAAPSKKSDPSDTPKAN